MNTFNDRGDTGQDRLLGTVLNCEHIDQTESDVYTFMNTTLRYAQIIKCLNCI